MLQRGRGWAAERDQESQCPSALTWRRAQTPTSRPPPSPPGACCAGRGPGWPAEWPASQRSLSLYFWQSVSRPMWQRNMQAISWAANIVVTIYSEQAGGAGAQGARAPASCACATCLGTGARSALVPAQ